MSSGPTDAAGSNPVDYTPVVGGKTEHPTVTFCLGRHDRMYALKAPFLTDWNDIRYFVRPISVAFNPVSQQYQYVRTEYMYDGTAMEALEELSCALHSYLSSPAERWFELQIEGETEYTLDDDAIDWLDMVSERIYASYNRTSSNFNLAIHECYMDLGSFGTACLYQEWDSDCDDVVFNSKPVQFVYLLEDSKGRVDTVHQSTYWTLRNIAQEFGVDNLPPKLKKYYQAQNLERIYEVIHCVYPRKDRPKAGGLLPQNKKYASAWICKDTRELIHESGYDDFPYACARWIKMATEVWGRGPAKKCLPDIKMLNAMERTIIIAGQKAVDPPLILANDGFMLPIRTSPGSLIFKEEEDRKIDVLKFEGNLPWAEDKCKQKRDFISRCFYSDWIHREQKKAEQTATEVQDERDEMLRLLAPIFARVVTELHGPTIARTYKLLNEHGKIPPAPVSIQKKQLKLAYLNPAVVAMLGTRADTIGRFMQDLVPFAQQAPSILDVIDPDKVAVEYALLRKIPRRILRNKDELAQLRDQRQKTQAASQIAQIAQPASQAIKNISDAQKNGMQIPVGMPAGQS